CGGAYPGGAWWVELDSARTEADLLERVAGVLRLEPSADVASQVAERLRGAGGPSLLVLDNTEQIEAASRAVASLLKAVPDLTCLTTSRRALEIAAEKLQEVEPLPQDEAEALFLDRARARQADFERTPENEGDIAALVRALEGVPLAIEMAAARIGMMTPRDILARLTERFRLLQTRSTHLPPRQRTLLEAVDWSYDLLTEDDRDLLGQVAVFHGGFTLEAAEAVCDVFDIFEGVDSLRRHSFLRATTDDRAQTRRFAMLEFLRAYAERKREEQLGAEAGDAVRKRHARYYRDLAEEKVPLLRTADEAEAHAAVAAELENLRAALAFAERTADHELCARLALALSTPLHDLGYWDELTRVLASGLKAADSAGDDRRRAALTLRVASLAHDRGDLDAARAGAESARALREAANDAEGIADAENLLGLIAMDAERYDEAEAHLVSARDRRAPGDHAGIAHALYNLARLASLRGDQTRARALYEESLTPRRASGDLRGEAKTLLSLGAVAYLADDFAGARDHYDTALGLLRVLGDVQGIATLLYNLGELAEKNGDMSRAIMLYHHAEERFRSLSSPLADLAKSELDRLHDVLGEEAWSDARRAASECSWETLC
ncbi:MAG TPA: tetratricopeptide repeat protein, partial [Armatimonadaceae bacterium]|nr:tetratricopeptide repeat protein [Armatimonadaceae bacterium]